MNDSGVEHRSSDMSGRVWASVWVVCVICGVAALLPMARTGPAGESPPNGPTGPPRLVVREADVPEIERKPDGPIRVQTIEYVHGSDSDVVVRNEVFTREVDPALRASGRRPLELFDALLSPRRGVVLYQLDLSVFVGIFDPEDGQRARVSKMTTCGPVNEIESARLVEDAQGLRAEIFRRHGGRIDVYEIAVAHGRPECRRTPEAE